MEPLGRRGLPHFEGGANGDPIVDFNLLASADPEFSRLYKKNHMRVDFQDPEQYRQLAISTARVYYKLELSLPLDRLCPAIPNRISYVRWIRGVVLSSRPRGSSGSCLNDLIVGMDVGVGASCIYPLLSLADEDTGTWKFVGSELDEENYKSAQDNVERNQLADRIALVRVTSPDDVLPLPLLKELEADFQTLTFTMCNPPFFTSAEDMAATGYKAAAPPTACTGAPIEMVAAGGDYGFAMKLLAASIDAKKADTAGRPQWYSCLLGKKSSFTGLVDAIRARGITNWAAHCLDPAGKTRRWCVCWSFEPWRAAGVGGAGAMGLPHQHIPPSTWAVIKVRTVGDIAEEVGAALGRFPVRWEWEAAESAGMALSEGDVWSRAARRKRARERGERDVVEEVRWESARLVVRIRAAARAAEDGSELEVDWVKGERHDEFTSFVGMLRTWFRDQAGRDSAARREAGGD